MEQTLLALSSPVLESKLIHVNVWQKPPQYCKVISLQLIKINEKNKKIKQAEVEKGSGRKLIFKNYKRNMSLGFLDRAFLEEGNNKLQEILKEKFSDQEQF